MAKSIYQATRTDADYTNASDIRTFSLAYPEEFDEALERLEETLKHPQTEPGLTPLEFILRRLEKEARAILTRHGYSTDLDELSNLEDENTYPVKIEGGGMALKCDVDIHSLSAKKVLFSALNLRDAISNGKAEEAAIEMMRLIYSAISADMYVAIMTGIRAKTGQRGRQGRSFEKTGIAMVIRKALAASEHLSPNKLWSYFEKKHDVDIGQKPHRINDYDIYFSAGKLKQAFSAGKDIKTQGIGKEAFRKMFYKIRKRVR